MENTFVYSGLQNAAVYLLNSKGRPKGTGLVAYTGISMYATKSYNPTLPQPRKVPHPGNDRLLKTQIFPGQEAASAELAVGAEDLDLIAALTGTTIKEIAGLKMLPHLTDLQGKEKQVGLILWQDALSRRTSTPGYHYHMISSSRMVPILPGAGNDPIDMRFDITINPSENYLWGAPLSPLSDIYDLFSGVPETGASEAGIFSGFGDYIPRIAAFVSGSNTTVFDLPANMPAVSTDNMVVFTAAPTDDEATLVDPADYTPTVNGITFDAGQASGTEVIILFQTESND
jgi:hypothetical protein